MKLKNANIILTGASSGIGLDTLKLLIAEGANVFAVSRTMEEHPYSNARLIKFNADLSKTENVEAVFKEALKHFETINLYIANAGFTYFETLEKADQQHIDKIFAVNVDAVMYAAVKMKELYRDQPFNFMATLSAVSFLSLPGYALYSATKASLRGFFDAYRLEMAEDQILQTSFPVATDSDFFNRADQPYKPWPVQSTQHVAKKLVQGLKKDKKNIYPSRLFKYGMMFLPFIFKLYVKMQQKKFNQYRKENLL